MWTWLVVGVVIGALAAGVALVGIGIWVLGIYSAVNGGDDA